MNKIKKISELSTKELKTQYIALNNLIENIDCYGNKDLLLFNDIGMELNRRGIRVVKTVKFRKDG